MRKRWHDTAPHGPQQKRKPTDGHPIGQCRPHWLISNPTVNMREQLVKRYYALSHERFNLVNPQACGIRKEMLTHPTVVALDQQIKEVCEQLILPENRVQPKDDWERHHGIWLLVSMEDDGYLPGELLRVRTSTSVTTAEGVQRGVLCNKMHQYNGSREVVLIFNKDEAYTFYGAEQVMPGPFLM